MILIPLQIAKLVNRLEKSWLNVRCKVKTDITGLLVTGKKYEPEPYIPPVSDPSPVPPPSPSKGGKKDKKGDKGTTTPEPPPQPQVSQLEKYRDEVFLL